MEERFGGGAGGWVHLLDWCFCQSVARRTLRNFAAWDVTSGADVRGEAVSHAEVGIRWTVGWLQSGLLDLLAV